MEKETITVEILQFNSSAHQGGGVDPSHRKHPDHSASKKRINRIRGQLDAVARMIDSREYCPNIIQQIRAATSALRGLEAEILGGHLRGCVKSALASKDANETDAKIEEIMRMVGG